MRIDLNGIVGSGELWLKIMKIICGDTHDKSMVDLGCHHAPYTPMLGFKERTYVDIQNRPLDDENEQQFFVQENILCYLLDAKNVDVSICSDVIEHLNIEKGRLLLHLMSNSSTKQIIFTPLGEYMISEDENPDLHRSGWTPEMLPDYLAIVLPDFHPALNTGAWFGVNCDNEEKLRIINEIKKIT